MMIMRFGYLRANPTNATTHVTTPLCSHWYTPTYMVQPSRGHPQEVLIHFVTWSTKYLSRCKYQIAQRCAVSTGLGRLNGTAVPDKWRLRRWIIYIYIYTHTHTYTYLCVCVCACVLPYRHHFGSKDLQKRTHVTAIYAGEIYWRTSWNSLCTRQSRRSC